MPKTFLILVMLVGVLLFVKEYFQLYLQRTRESATDLPQSAYQRQTYLLSGCERALLAELERAVGRGYCVFAKVGLAEMVRTGPDLNRAQRMAAQEKLEGVRLDFVICRRSDLAISAAVTRSGKKAGGGTTPGETDLVRSTLAAARIPVVILRADKAYEAAELSGELKKARDAAEAADRIISRQTTLHGSTTEAAKDCPGCGARLVKRRIAGGRMDGNIVLACPSYPDCRHIRPLTIPSAPAGHIAPAR